MMISTAALCMALGPMLIPLTTALTLLVASDSKSLTAISFTPSSSSARASLLVLNKIPISSSGPLVSDPSSPGTVVHGASRYHVGVRQDNVTLSSLVDNRVGGCVLDMYDGQRLWVNHDEMRGIVRSMPAAGATFRVDDPADVAGPQQPISDDVELNPTCPERLLEHNLGLSVLDSDFVWNFSRDTERRWELKGTINVTGAEYAGRGVSALTYGRFLYLLNPKNGLLTRHFMSDPAVRAQDLDLSSSLPRTNSAIFLSSRTSRFPTSHIYATIGNRLNIIALPNDPSGEIHTVARIKTSLRDIRSGMLAGPEGMYLVLAGKEGMRVYQRTQGGAAVVEVSRLEMESVSALTWL